MDYHIEIKNQIATFTMNRPDMRNAINSNVMEGLEDFVSEVENNQEISFAVITGSGEKAFCSGGDLSEFHGFRTAEDAYPMLSRMAGILYRLSTLPVPVIALVNGAAVGGGCEIASACDYRLVSEKAKAGFIQGTLAITSGWGGTTQLIEKMGQHDVVLRFVSEATVLDASSLEAIGWATEQYEGNGDQALEQFLGKMSSIHRSVHRAYKSLMIRSWEGKSVRERMLEEAKQCARLWESEAHHEAVARFLGRR
ncbi:enoyl-CoA hydratase/isomerase family protein [Sporosarcina sp. Te-1]|uniref:enoyl-CoA hydratase/isomerase family protein n=1 Tax=Sporosarcina sp. Te-1 TaxID=2818390 RepID=UPI001A9D621F|nr:enoyl-CoA hydratase/isomerase family protein [Sporosarcina sp. Te-1]QTD42414.1 enoyl-CoA hydratase/isomerase family protein [Sporosarcina sp. Te-1]